MTRRIIFSLVLAASVAPLPLRAADPIAAVVCAPRDEMLTRLQKGYGAELRGLGLRNEETVIEVWADDKGDWTLVQNYSTGQSCIVAMGVGWEGLEGGPPA